MEKSPARKRAEARAAIRRLQQALRLELRRRGGTECRYVAGCPVAKAGNCPGFC